MRFFITLIRLVDGKNIQVKTLLWINTIPVWNINYGATTIFQIAALLHKAAFIHTIIIIVTPNHVDTHYTVFSSILSLTITFILIKIYNIFIFLNTISWIYLNQAGMASRIRDLAFFLCQKKVPQIGNFQCGSL